MTSEPPRRHDGYRSLCMIADTENRPLTRNLVAHFCPVYTIFCIVVAVKLSALKAFCCDWCRLDSIAGWAVCNFRRAEFSPSTSAFLPVFIPTVLHTHLSLETGRHNNPISGRIPSARTSPGFYDQKKKKNLSNTHRPLRAVKVRKLQ